MHQVVSAFFCGSSCLGVVLWWRNVSSCTRVHLVLHDRLRPIGNPTLGLLGPLLSKQLQKCQHMHGRKGCSRLPYHHFSSRCVSVPKTCQI